MADPETLVLVPGLNSTEAVFAPQIERLRSGRPVLIADHRRDDSLGAIAGRLLAAAPERFALAGHSMGGYVALEVLRQAPDRVSRIALLNTSARPDTPERKEDRERLIALAGGGRFEEVHSALWDALVHPSRRGDKHLEATVREMQRQTGPEAFIRQQKAIMGRVDSRALLPGLEIPTLVLVGEEDSITPPDLSREMAEMIEWASFVLVPECGHLAPLERPAHVTAAIEAWLCSGMS